MVGVRNTDWLDRCVGRGWGGGVGLYFLAFHACEMRAVL